jgi:radical SAM protein (TIGR01212 family)
VQQQLSEGIEFHVVRYRNAVKYLAYFQAYSNTHAPLSTLKHLYQQALDMPNVVGLVIGTRPDCVDAEKLDYLAQLNEKVYISVEYGVESTNNIVLKNVNRGHDFEKSVWAIHETAQRGISTGAHFIIGLPGEEADDFIGQLYQINALPLTTIKFHQLQIFRNTLMAVDYTNNPAAFNIYSFEEYLDIITRVVEHLNPAFVIERMVSEAPPRHLLSPSFGGLRAFQVQQKFEKMLEVRDTWQGRLYDPREKVPIIP